MNGTASGRHWQPQEVRVLTVHEALVPTSGIQLFYIVLVTVTSLRSRLRLGTLRTSTSGC